MVRDARRSVGRRTNGDGLAFSSRLFNVEMSTIAAMLCSLGSTSSSTGEVMLVAVAHVGEGRAGDIRVTAAVAERVAEVMEVLATPSRVHILGCLRTGPKTVREIVEAVEMAQSAVSHQLRILRDLRFVVGTRDGRSVIYSLHDDHVASLLSEALYHVEHLDLAGAREDRPSRR